MLLPLFFFFAVHVASSPSPWTKVINAHDELEFRWSLPVANACDVEVRTTELSQAREFSSHLTITYQIQRDIRRSRGQDLKKGQTTDRDVSLKVLAGQIQKFHIESCFTVTAVKGTVTPAISK